MKTFIKKDVIKIPKNISIIYCQKTKLITFFTGTTKKSFILKTKVILLAKQNLLKVTRVPFISNIKQKSLKEIQGTTVALLKKKLLEIYSLTYKKLKFIGVGYKVFLLETGQSKLLNFKLGYSHQIFFKIPVNLTIFCLKSTKLFVSGISNSYVNQIAALIRSYKTPEPYKGKGILYENEKIVLKEGKKI